MTQNPPATPTSPDPAAGTPAETPAPAYLLWMRWALSLWAILTGLNEVGFYLINWTLLMQKAALVPAYHPLPFLALGILHLLGGIVLLMRSKWTILVVGLHFAGYLAQVFWHTGLTYVPALMMFYLSVEALTLWLCLYLWAYNRLR